MQPSNNITHYSSLLVHPDFYVFASAILVAIIAGVLGCFVVWRNMSYFGDSLSHSALLGIVLGIISGLSMNIAILITCLLFAALIIWLQQKKIFSNDTILGILAHSAIALGITLLGIIKYKYFVNEHSILFGELLKANSDDFESIALGGFVVLFLVIKLWDQLVLTSISEDLAKAEGVNILNIQMAFTFMITLVVALSIKIVGILLVTSLMIIPAATARQISRSPKQMAVFSSLFGAISAILGILLSVRLAVSTGPLIVVCSSALFIIFNIFFSIRK